MNVELLANGREVWVRPGDLSTSSRRRIQREATKGTVLV
jgi:hypothetical protein